MSRCPIHSGVYMYCQNVKVSIQDFDGPDGGRDEVASLHFDAVDSDTLDNVISSVLNDEYNLFESAIAEVTFTVEP
tara:strand:- start:231 stop:458 length:228 start_codon:yes stop_codon:yes gene_type:complete